MEQIARFPLHHLAVKAEREQLPAGRLVTFDGKSEQNDIKARLAVAGSPRVLGVTQYDSANPKADPAPSPFDGTLRVDIVRSGSIVRVEAGEEVHEGDLLAAGASGKVVVADAAVAAHVDTGLVADNNGISWTATEPGGDGNDLTVTIVDPAGNNVALSVDVDGDDIVVTGATDGASALTSTAAQVMAAVQEHDVASQLVSVANKGASSGAGVVKAVAETPLTGGTESSDNQPLLLAFTDGESGDIIEAELF
jgi:hypothetical protein